MKKILLLLLIFPLVFFGQETIFKNGVEVIYPIGYNYDFELSTKEKAHFISEKKEELLVYVFKFRKHITVDIINELLLSENSSINWKLFNGPTGGKWSTISTGINGVCRLTLVKSTKSSKDVR